MVNNTIRVNITAHAYSNTTTTTEESNLTVAIVRSIINSTSKLFDEPTKMSQPVKTEGVDHWALIFGFAFLFAVSVGCVYLVVRCIRGDGKSDEEIVNSESRNVESSRLIPVKTGSQPASADAEDGGQSGLSASRQRFLEQRRQQVQQQSYGATS
jgi:hypothetical protein